MTLANTFGAVFIGLVSSSVMYGLTLLQTHYPKDPARLKWTVAVLTVADSVHLILSTWAVYWYLVANFGNFVNLGAPHWSVNLQTDFNGFVSAGVQLLFTRRVYLLSKNKYLVAILLVLTTVHFSFGVYFSVRTFNYKSFAEYTPIAWIPYAGLSSAAAADIIIAISMCYFLKKSRTGFGRTDTLVTILMMYSINTGRDDAKQSHIYKFLLDAWEMLNSRDNLRQLAYPTNGTYSFQLSELCNGSKGGAATEGMVTYRYPDEMPPQQQPLELVVSTDAERSKGNFPSFNHTDSNTGSLSREAA
ncbi:hypothetical protein BD410DRAFT_809037 [Rickenella mellea]|uniref:DUF6534 domain-containing protein n=1 Tax=Rickenella mellea TaxID=50990 RepID=A0A4Y7PIK0_9AGAM|nr:hypothetical protein BD410DRAFT_809037 [Rickenella mellea]